MALNEFGKTDRFKGDVPIVLSNYPKGCKIANAVAVAEYDVGKLIKKLYDKNYVTAADYLYRASKNMFSYVHRWLLTGIVGPRASSMIERMMRELARRLKRMAYAHKRAMRA